MTLDWWILPFSGINSKNILKKSCLQEYAKKWVAITAGTLLNCYYFRILFIDTFFSFFLGLGDRHVQNILIDKITAEVIHIDLGIAFEQGKILPTPETIPFRLTRDIIDGFGPSGVEGTFRKCAETTLKVGIGSKKVSVV